MIKKKQDKKHGQMSLNQGLKVFGERGRAAVRKEVKSFMDIDVLETPRVRIIARRKRGITPLNDDAKEEKDR